VSLAKTIAVPFTVPAIDLPVVPPPVCALNKDADWQGHTPVVLVPTLAGDTTAPVIEALNGVARVLAALEGLVELARLAVAPLALVSRVLASMPKAQVSNGTYVELTEFEDYDSSWPVGIDFGLDDEMSSFIAIGPTGTRLRFSDEYGGGVVGAGSRQVRLLDLLALNDTVEGVHIRKTLGISEEQLGALASALSPLLEGGRLGIGVTLCQDLSDADVPETLRTFVKPGSTTGETGATMNNDIGRVEWLLPV
jgi:hypothetical protein